MFADFSETEKLQYKIDNLEYRIEQWHSKSSETVTLKTADGQVKGDQRRTLYGDLYYSFERIPFAQPPLGELRFRAPKPITPWKGVLDCTHYGPKPMQPDLITGEIVGNENCLHLNVYTNNLKVSKSRPVMIWIYGGGFQIGEATREYYGPDYFMKKDVVLVTVQYRLGALGFLSLDSPHLHMPGNAGLKDQIMAIKWIKRNCGVFGGDSECITLFGSSAGSYSVHALMLSEQAKGLFHRAILQSGVSLMEWNTFHGSKDALALAQFAGYTGQNTDDRHVFEFLLKCSGKQIIEAQKKYMEKAQCAMVFGPCVETYVTSHTFTRKPFKELLQNAWGNNIPLMIGGNSNEGLMFLPFTQKNPKAVQAQMTTCENYVPNDAMLHPNNKHERLQKGLQLRQLHVSGPVPTTEDFFEISSFAQFWNPMQQALWPRLRHTTNKIAPTYLYRFDFDSENMLQPFRLIRAGLGVKGVAHSDELAYLFSNILTRPMDRQTREYQTMKRMIGLWTTFAATGNPSAGKINGMKGIKWQPLPHIRRPTADSGPNSNSDSSNALKASRAWKCLNINDELKIIELPEWSKLCVWQQLYDNRGRNKLTEKAEEENVPPYAKAML